jgi:hypothetical protein
MQERNQKYARFSNPGLPHIAHTNEATEPAENLLDITNGTRCCSTRSSLKLCPLLLEHCNTPDLRISGSCTIFSNPIAKLYLFSKSRCRCYHACTFDVRTADWCLQVVDQGKGIAPVLTIISHNFKSQIEALLAVISSKGFKYEWQQTNRYSFSSFLLCLEKRCNTWSGSLLISVCCLRYTWNYNQSAE